MIPLTDEENKPYEEQEACHFCEGKFYTDEDNENYKKRKTVKDHCHYTEKFRGAAHNTCNLICKVPDNIPIIIYNATYETQFIINHLAKEFKDKPDCKGENMGKYIPFSAPIKRNVMLVKQLHIN